MPLVFDADEASLTVIDAAQSLRLPAVAGTLLCRLVSFAKDYIVPSEPDDLLSISSTTPAEHCIVIPWVSWKTGGPSG